MPNVNVIKNKALELVFVALLFSLAHVLIYQCVWMNEYARTDDYTVGYRAATGKMSWLHNAHLQEGRPLYLLFLKSVHAHITTIADLSWIRLLAVVISVSMWTVAYSLLRNTGTTRTTGLVIACLIATTPAWGIYLAWSVCAIYPLSALLSMLSGHLYWKYSTSVRKQHHILFTSFTLLIASVCVYQPTICFFFLLILLNKINDCKRYIASWIGSLIFFSVTILIYWITYRYIVMELVGSTRNTERGAFVTDPIQRFISIFGGIGWRSILHWSASSTSNFLKYSTAAFIATTIFIGIFSMVRKQGLKAPLIILLIFATFLAINAPIAAAKEPYFPVRTLIGYYMFFICIGIRGLDTLPVQYQKIQNASLLIVALISSVSARNFVFKGLVEPHTIEVSKIKKHIDVRFRQEPAGVLFICPRWNEVYLTKTPFNYEYSGTPSSWWSAGIPGMMNFILNEKFNPDLRNGIWKDYTIVVSKSTLPIDYPYTFPIIDAALALTGKTSIPKETEYDYIDPAMGHVKRIEGGFEFSQSLGIFKRMQNNTMVHSHLGIISIGEDIQTPNLQLTANGQYLLTTLAQFPSLYSPEEKTYMRFETDNYGYHHITKQD